jgi:hypothetical protein
MLFADDQIILTTLENNLQKSLYIITVLLWSAAGRMEGIALKAPLITFSWLLQCEWVPRVDSDTFNCSFAGEGLSHDGY